MSYRYSLIALMVLYFIVTLWSIDQRSIQHVPKGGVTFQKQLSGPDQFARFHKEIRTPEGASGPEYERGYRLKESRKAMAQLRTRGNARIQSTIEWTERGPANVPGRTRGVIVDPDDPTKNTWYAGSAGGGVWKTTNAGAQWTLLTPDISNLATTVLAMAGSNHNIIYMGTGEGFGNLDGINGNGMFKSLDRGQTWNHLPSTIAFSDVNRIVVSPTDPNIVVVATDGGIQRTIDGGTNWTQVSGLADIQDLKVNPANFNIQYAARYGVGVLKSTDAGVNWSLSNTGMSPNGRVELAVSPVNTSRIFASCEGGLSGNESDLYVSSDAGVTWSVVDVSFNSAAVNFLGGQGWYDNTIACDPFNANIVYFGGVNMWRLTLGSGSVEIANYKIEENSTQPFLFLNGFANIQYDNLRLTAGPEAGQKSVEIRFGPGISQFAHRFTVPAGATSGVPVTSYSYASYTQVPFQAWDVTIPASPRQLMVSFRDQANNNQFDLVNPNFGTDPLLNSREYTYINDVTYSLTPNASIAVAGGQEHRLIYNFFPALVVGATWDPGNLPTSSLLIHYTGIQKVNATTVTVTDAYGQFDAKNRFITYGVDVHPDQHNIVMILMSGSTYKILNASDGGLFVSNTSASPGINQGDWTMSGAGYRTAQFYGADKRPGFDQYVGGTQDNGTWRSPASGSSTSTTNYVSSFGGDGFEVIWNNLDDQKIIGGSQGNNFLRSVNGGQSWSTATVGLSGSHPFLSKLANSRANPDLIYTLSSAGVFRSTNFGSSWTLTPITNKWGPASTLMDIEVSRANANIVWAGSGMVNASNLRSIHVSTDAGLTFNATENPNTSLISGGITKLASHPFEQNTAYALFSQAGNPKILRTMDLGQTWEDISGYDAGDVSTRGFPDVAVYCLYVRPDNPDIIWAGTEIGIIESLDNGLSWALLTDFQNISVWDMKGQDDQVVIATHGRGIWTATIHEPQIPVTVPAIIASGTSPKEELFIKVDVQQHFDRIEFYTSSTVGGGALTLTGTINNIDPSTIVVQLNGLSPGMKNVKMISYVGTSPFHSKVYVIDYLDILAVKNSYSNYFGDATTMTLKGFGLSTFTTGGAPGERNRVHSNHPYTEDKEYTMIIRHPIVVSSILPTVYYEDIAIVEYGSPVATFPSPAFKDYVVLEASKDGLDWTPLEDGYNALSNGNWQATFDAGTPATAGLFISHQVDVSNTFVAGDTLLFRYRLFSDAAVTGWGAVLDFITIQEEPTGLEPGSIGLRMIVFPNPASVEITAEFEFKNPTPANLEVVDLYGRVVHSREVAPRDPGTYRETFSMSNQQSGPYFVILKTSAGNRVAKVIVRR